MIINSREPILDAKPSCFIKNILSNFKEAERELKKLLSRFDENSVKKYLLESLREWKCNSPLSPWMGGAREELVKSVKQALKSAIKDCLFIEEVLYPTLCEIESLLNNLLLTSISDDISD